MSTTTISLLATGAPLYRARTGWPPAAAALMTFAILVLAAGLGFVSLLGGAAVIDPSLAILDEAESEISGLMLTSQLAMQCTCVVLALWVAGFYASNRSEVLALGPVPGGSITHLRSFLLLIVVSGAFSALAWHFARDDIIADLSQLWPLFESPYWWLLLILAVIGAPLSEEIVFRGFLQSALAQSPLGFWGAVLVTNTAWTALHAGYSWTGLLDVFVAGLVFSWLLWRTGSLWVPIICHGLYNGLIFAVLWAFDFSQFVPTPAG